MTDTLDLSNFDFAHRAEAGAALTLLHPITGEVLDVVIRLRGMDAPAWHAVIREQIDTQINAGKRSLTAAELEEAHIERLARATIEWQGVVYQGHSLVCTPANARRLYSEQLWIREQVARFVEDRENFFGE
ncbi:hypothetical protein [Sneathiella glossodoripedis]|uniref:hypothetical protein n=1 Tax=Sneathiella glossodoripedis TaxID=418853 RepID=UPI00046E90DC|nr:hypothetical protein [Sneathiella glossodoripedis]